MEVIAAGKAATGVLILTSPVTGSTESDWNRWAEPAPQLSQTTLWYVLVVLPSGPNSIVVADWPLPCICTMAASFTAGAGIGNSASFVVCCVAESVSCLKGETGSVLNAAFDPVCCR